MFARRILTSGCRSSDREHLSSAGVTGGDVMKPHAQGPRDPYGFPGTCGPLTPSPLSSAAGSTQLSTGHRPPSRWLEGTLARGARAGRSLDTKSGTCTRAPLSCQLLKAEGET